MNNSRGFLERPCKSLMALIVLALVATSASSSTVKRIGTDELVKKSTMVFQGEVQDRWSGIDRGYITTFVRFSVEDVVKGEFKESTLILRFLGGEHDGVVDIVDGSNVPAVGERGIYFVESASTPMVNPLYGWTQGHFLLRVDEGGTDRVYTLGGEPVRALEATETPLTLEITHGHAAGVVVSAQANAQPLAAVEFKQLVLQILEAQE